MKTLLHICLANKTLISKKQVNLYTCDKDKNPEELNRCYVFRILFLPLLPTATLPSWFRAFHGPLVLHSEESQVSSPWAQLNSYHLLRSLGSSKNVLKCLICCCHTSVSFHITVTTLPDFYWGFGKKRRIHLVNLSTLYGKLE